MPAGNAGANQRLVVGRERERERLLAQLDRALAGRGSLTIISGEAGVGKTTLVRTLTDEATSRSALVLTGHCYDLTTTPPYGPWSEILRACPRIDELPSLGMITGPGDGLDGPKRGDELFAWGIQLFQALASRQPLVLVLEDLHWSDRASLDFLRAASRALTDERLMLIATYRGDELERGHPLYQLLPAIVRESEPERIDLHPLDERATGQLIRHRFDLSGQDESTLLDHLQRHAEGNPFFADEILYDLVQRQILQQERGRWRLGDLAQASLPVLLRQVLDHRLGRVPEDTRHALRLAAVVGQEVDIEIWARVSGLAETEFVDVVDRATDEALILSSPDGRTVSFRHALIREALYAEILPLRGREIHREIADLLIATNDADPDVVAYHLKRAGDSRAAEWLVRAGDRAHYTVYSLRIALARYREALDALGADDLEARGWLLTRIALTIRFTDPLSGLRDATEAGRIARSLGDDALEAMATFARGINLVYSGQVGHDVLARVCDQIDALSEADRRRLRDRRNGRPIDTRAQRLQLAVWLAIEGYYHEAAEAAERAFSLLDPGATESIAQAAVLHWGAGIIWAALGNPTHSAKAFAQSRDAFTAAGHHFFFDTVAGYIVLANAIPYRTDDLALRASLESQLLAFGAGELAHVTNDPADLCLAPLYLLDGRWTELLRVAEEIGRDMRSGMASLHALAPITELRRRVGDVDGARAAIQSAFVDGWATPRERMRVWFAQALDLQRTAANLAIDTGEIVAAREWIDMRQRWLDSSRRVLGLAENALLEVRFHRSAGDLKAALEFAHEALRLAGNPRQPLALIAARRELGALLAEKGSFADATTHLTASLDLAERCRTPYERALTLIELGGLSIRTGETDAATDALSEAEAILEGLGAIPALDHVELLRSQLRSPNGRGARHGLSERELDVLRLVAQGLTDRQIGDQLFISRRTVSQHVRSIFNKLNVGSRTAAALAAVERHLLDI